MSIHSSRGREWETKRKTVLERDGYSCVVCGAPATQVDHIVPKVKGGTDELSNLQAMCATHNLKKGDRTIERGTYWDTEFFPDGLPLAPQQ